MGRAPRLGTERRLSAKFVSGCSSCGPWRHRCSRICVFQSGIGNKRLVACASTRLVDVPFMHLCQGYDRQVAVEGRKAWERL